jgi:hypothetical protein
MRRKKSLCRIFPFYLTLTALVLTWGLNLPARGQEVFHTKYTEVRANSTTDFLEMERRLHVATVDSAYQPQTTGRFAVHPGFPRLAVKIDAILIRVAQILNLSPSRTPRINIVLLSNGKEVRQRHVLLVPGQRPGLFGYGFLEAFYYVGTRTMYLSLKDLHEGILAHELTHHLLCTALALPPPAHSQEAWAQYVESRL